MSLLYFHANQMNRMVIGTSNKTEILLGYFTKYGDGGVDLEPIGGLYKTEVWELEQNEDLETIPNTLGISEEQLDSVMSRIEKSEHKRNSPPVPQIF